MTAQQKHTEKGINFLELIVRLVAATTATIAAVRACQGALRAWRRVVAAVRPAAAGEEA